MTHAVIVKRSRAGVKAREEGSSEELKPAPSLASKKSRESDKPASGPGEQDKPRQANAQASPAVTSRTGAVGDSENRQPDKGLNRSDPEGIHGSEVPVGKEAMQESSNKAITGPPKNDAPAEKAWEDIAAEREARIQQLEVRIQQQEALIHSLQEIARPFRAERLIFHASHGDDQNAALLFQLLLGNSIAPAEDGIQLLLDFSRLAKTHDLKNDLIQAGFVKLVCHAISLDHQANDRQHSYATLFKDAISSLNWTPIRSWQVRAVQAFGAAVRVTPACARIWHKALVDMTRSIDPAVLGLIASRTCSDTGAVVLATHIRNESYLKDYFSSLHAFWPNLPDKDYLSGLLQLTALPQQPWPGRGISPFLHMAARLGDRAAASWLKGRSVALGIATESWVIDRLVQLYCGRMQGNRGEQALLQILGGQIPAAPAPASLSGLVRYCFAVGSFLDAGGPRSRAAKNCAIHRLNNAFKALRSNLRRTDAPSTEWMNRFIPLIARNGISGWTCSLLACAVETLTKNPERPFREIVGELCRERQKALFDTSQPEHSFAGHPDDNVRDLLNLEMQALLDFAYNTNHLDAMLPSTV